MKTSFLTVLVLAGGLVQAEPFDGHQHDILDLKGQSVEVAEIEQKEWNGLKTVVSNGHLRVTKRYHMRGGDTVIGPGASLSIGPDAHLATGAGDARTRRIDLAPGAKLRFEVRDWSMDHTKITVPKGAEWFADVGRFVLAGAMKDNEWRIAGKATLLRGVNVAECKYGNKLKIVVEPGGELWLGGPVKDVTVELKGGKVFLFWDGDFAPGVLQLAGGSEKDVTRVKKLPKDFPARYTFRVETDDNNRCYYISADHFKESIKELGFRYPNPDAESETKVLTARATDPLFRKRFPAGKGPWTVQAAIKDIHGDTYRTNIVIRKTATPKRPPAPNETVLVGQCGYGDATDLATDILTNDLCNLYVGWHSAGKTLGEKLPEDLQGQWREMVKSRPLWSMSIYGADNQDLQAKLRDLYGARYLGNNIGEYASYLYQDDNCRPKSIPNDRNLQQSKDHLVNRFIHAVPTGWMGRFPYSFSTCGAALSCYELAGGIDFICNEQWAIGAQNLAHTTSEARGAARKWKPEYWCAWNAHEWQTTGIPYHTDQKYDSCYVGYLQEYVMGTSIIVLESGAQGTQAWQYTASYPGQPKEERAKEGYDGEVARRYREVTKKFYDWVKAHPRDTGTPETKIAMALGNLDAYLGMNGGFSIWAQHANAATNAPLWKYGAPEHTQCALEDLFFPLAPKAVEPFANRWLAGTPFGQVDVVNVDDDIALADLRRYDLLVFGGWNTMTPQAKDVLERYVRQGGTLLMSRPELTTRIDRDYVSYTDKDLLPLFGFLPPEGKPGDFVEKKIGKGRYILFTAHDFPAANAAAKKAYGDLVAKLARDVKQTVTIDGDAETLKCITYAVYPKTIYFLNVDTRHERTFTWVKNGVRKSLTLKPCEIKEVGRHK